MEKEAIKRKIRAMLATAADKSNEHASAMAMRIAAAWMLRYNINRDEVSVESEQKATVGPTTRMSCRQYEINLIAAAAVLYGCRPIFYDSGRKGFMFVGRENNIDACEETLMWLDDQVAELYNKEATDRSAQYRNSFLDACSMRVLQRARDLVRPKELAPMAGRTELVVEGYFKKMARENTEAVIAAGIDVRPARLIKTRYGSGAADGNRAGDKVQLNRQVR